MKVVTVGRIVAVLEAGLVAFFDICVVLVTPSIHRAMLWPLFVAFVNFVGVESISWWWHWGSRPDRSDDGNP